MSCNGAEAIRTADFVRSYIDQTGRLDFTDYTASFRIAASFEVVLQTFVVPPSGPIFRRWSKSTSFPLARSLSARLVAASKMALADDGMPQRAVVRMRSDHSRPETAQRRQLHRLRP
ncbi:hypothetical protein [Brevundimonas faecalis]|uniref:Uncharacterized protein n=1 Tax=Brevundimonas faecalis TaxID=947378 RepID=A0ABV2RAS1_9CAUL